MVGVGRKNSGKGKCSFNKFMQGKMFPQQIHARENVPPTNSCKGWARVFTNRNAPPPKFSARFDMFLSVPGRAKSQLELEKEL